MAKNLGKYKQELQTRECLVQAIYQYLFHESNLNSLIDQFLKENTPKKRDSFFSKERIHQNMPELILGVAYVVLFLLVLFIVYALMT